MNYFLEFVSKLFLGFGGFGAAASTGGGLFGANTAAKPAFSFGGTSTASSGFGGFGTANTGTSLFAGSTAAKPGGLFGSTGKNNDIIGNVTFKLN